MGTITRRCPTPGHGHTQTLAAYDPTARYVGRSFASQEDAEADRPAVRAYFERRGDAMEWRDTQAMPVVSVLAL